MSERPKQPHAAKVGADGINLFSRAQAAGALGVSDSTLRKWHSQKLFVPAHQREGTYLYTAKQIAERRKLQNGKLAGLAFRLFEQGCSAVETVIELEAPPEAIAKLHAEWVKLSGGWVVAGPTGTRSSWERTYGIGKLTPAKLRVALELVASNPALRAKLLEAK